MLQRSFRSRPLPKAASGGVTPAREARGSVSAIQVATGGRRNNALDHVYSLDLPPCLIGVKIGAGIILRHRTVLANVVSPEREITQPRHRYVVVLDDSAEKLGSKQVPHDRRFELQLHPHPVEFTRPPLDPAGLLTQRSSRGFSSDAPRPCPQISAQKFGNSLCPHSSGPVPWTAPT